jgi:spermidine synthase
LKTFINKIKSYLVPIVVDRRRGTVTDVLEVRLFNGRYTLDADKVNYSFGCLHEVFERAFEAICLGSYQFKNILILGMGAGSIMSILTKTYKIKCPVTAVEKDVVVIDLANEYFNLPQYKNLTLIKGDALEFVRSSVEKFDLVLIDLFIEDEVPEIFASESFLRTLRNITTAHGIVVYNRLTDTQFQKEETDVLFQRFSQMFLQSQKLRLVDFYSENTLLISNTAQIQDAGPGSGKAAAIH